MFYLNKNDLSNILKMLDMAEQHNRSVSKKAIIDMKNKINKIINQKETFTDNIEILKIDEYFDSLLKSQEDKEHNKLIKELKKKQKRLFDELNATLAHRNSFLD